MNRVEFEGGATSSKIPRFELIPRCALVSMADIFEAGIREHGDKAWNELSANRSSAITKQFVLARLAHCVDHCYKMIMCIQRGLYDPTLIENHAGAIMFAGAVVSAWVEKEMYNDERLDLLLVNKAVSPVPPKATPFADAFHEAGFQSWERSLRHAPTAELERLLSNSSLTTDHPRYTKILLRVIAERVSQTSCPSAGLEAWMNGARSMKLGDLKALKEEIDSTKAHAHAKAIEGLIAEKETTESDCPF